MRLLRVLIPFLGTLPVAAAAQWKNSIERDEMTGKQQAFATSPLGGATHPMHFPYTATQAWVGFGCDGTDEWAYVGFSNQPNLTNTEPSNGYSFFTTRVKWDEAVDSMRFSQKWGDAFINFEDDSAAIAKMTTTGTLMLELEWFGENSTYFRLSLRGASAAIARARASCKPK